MGLSGGGAAVGVVHGFPAELTSFVGREVPAGEIADLLMAHRVVTVTGPGGSGKTRLAVEVAGRVAARFADGVWLAELAAAGDPGQVPAVVAAALEVPEQPGVPTVELLSQVLAGQQLLLVLDNCEHVIDAAARLCSTLLSVCDDLRVLATSREPMRTAGESRYRLGPMTLPDAADPHSAAGSEAVALFTDRARLADAHFVLDPEQVPVVARLVTRLDGLPLAIELAAARAEAMTVGQLLEHLDDGLSWLAEGDRLAAGRHRSLAAAVEWSYQLLTDSEQRVFRAVSVFPGPFTLEAAEAVAGDGAGIAVLRLVDCSLLVPSRGGGDGRPRYAMLETLRAFAASRLAAAGETGGVVAAQAGYAVRVANEAAVGLQSVEGEVAAARRLDAEGALMRQVLAWSVSHDPGLALRLAARLGWWWLLRGRLAGQYPMLCQITDAAEVGGDDWCAAQLWLGLAALFSSSPQGAVQHFTGLRDAALGRAPSPALVHGLMGRSVALGNLGRAGEAGEEAHRALRAAREIGYATGEVLALGTLSFAAVGADDLDGAVQAARQATQIMVGVPGVFVRWSRYVLTHALAAAGDFAAADEVCAAALHQAQEAGAWGDWELLLNEMVMLDVRAGRTQEAALHLREAVQVAVRSGTIGSQLVSLDCCGHLCAATGRPAEAVTVWAALTALQQLEHFPDLAQDARLRENLMRQARQALGVARTLAAEKRGASMSRAAAAEFVLMLADPRPSQRTAPGVGNLSPRERELVTLVAQGRTDAQIAAQLYISIRTVRSHLDRIRDKTACRRRADLTRLALAAGLI